MADVDRIRGDLASLANVAHDTGIAALDRSLIQATEQWRRQLLEAPNLRRTASIVSDSMAQAVAARQTYLSDGLTGLRLAGVETRLAIGQAAQDLVRMRSEVSGPLRALVRQAEQTQRFLAAGLRQAALVASVDWAARMREHDAEQRRMEAELRRYGWWSAPSWPVTLPGKLVGIGRSEGKRGLDLSICAMYSRDQHGRLRHLVDSWLDDPAFKARRLIIRDALDDHIAGRYRVSIPTLLPLVEGIATEVFDPSGVARNPYRPYRSWTDSEYQRARRLLADGMLETLTIIWRPIDFATAKPLARTLNRHLILHGRIIRYGTEANSLKVFLTLDHLASEVRTKRSRDSRKSVA